MRKLTGMITRLRNSLALALLAALLFFSCNQDSIFFDLSGEPEPVDPLIEGSSANIVTTGSNGYVYAASIGSSTVYQYTGGWSTPYSVPGGISQLAATERYLYAISRNNILYRVNGNGSQVPGGRLQSVYAANEMVFVGIGPGAGPYSVKGYKEESSPGTNWSESIPPISGISGLLKGVAFDGTDTYFVATEGSGGGIYEVDSSSYTVNRLESGNFKGIICVGNYIIAITNNGVLYSFDHTSSYSPLPPPASLGDQYYTGAMSPWYYYHGGTWDTTPSLLLLGFRGTGRTHGYREVSLDTTTGKPGSVAATPGGGPPGSSVDRRNRYQSSIEKHAVYSILQVPKLIQPSPPGGQPVIFASTAKDGLWSLKNDQWNAED
jgi:hypothetical protein